MGKWRFFKQDGDKLEGKVKYVLAEAKNPVLIQMWYDEDPDLEGSSRFYKRKFQREKKCFKEKELGSLLVNVGHGYHSLNVF